MSLNQTSFGKMPDGRAVDLYTFESAASGLTLKLTNYGGRIVEIVVPDRKGDRVNVNLGYDSLDGYVKPNPYFGAAVGRVANRIAGGKFTLDGTEYTCPTNNGPNTLHGGKVGFDKLLWNAQHASGEEGESVVTTLRSADGDQGFPGNLTATMTYTLLKDGRFRIDYEATTDRATPVNLTHHPYFNLAGAGNGTILSHVLTLDADGYTPVGAGLIPTGEVLPVAGTPFDFATPHRVGDRISQVPGGYDHNFCLRAGTGMRRAALVADEGSGRHMEISTDYPGIQFYSGNFLDGSIKGLGGTYVKHGGFCLETQLWPDAVHHENFPNVILRPGETYRYSTVYRFFAK